MRILLLKLKIKTETHHTNMQTQIFEVDWTKIFHVSVMHVCFVQWWQRCHRHIQMDYIGTDYGLEVPRAMECHSVCRYIAEVLNSGCRPVWENRCCPFWTHCWHSWVCLSPTFVQDDPATDGNTILAGRTETQSVYFIITCTHIKKNEPWHYFAGFIHFLYVSAIQLNSEKI